MTTDNKHSHTKFLDDRIPDIFIEQYLQIYRQEFFEHSGLRNEKQIDGTVFITSKVCIR